MSEENLVSDVISDMQRREESEFKEKIEYTIRNIADFQKQISELQVALAKEKATFKELKLEATNFADLIS